MKKYDISNVMFADETHKEKFVEVINRMNYADCYHFFQKVGTSNFFFLF